MTDLEEIKKKKLKQMMERVKYPDKPIKVTDENFDSMVSKYPLVVVDCWADWCMPCRIIAPVVEELAKKYKGRIVFGKLDVSANRTTPVKFGIRGIPTLLIFKKGKLVDRIIGAQPMPILEAKLKKHLDLD